MKSKTLKKIMAISLASLMALSAVGCANEKETSEGTETSVVPESTKESVQ